MHHHYKDILDLTNQKPRWWDEDGVPRFCEFGPKHVANIYAREVVLLRIRCQNCHRPFDVAMSWSWSVVAEPGSSEFKVPARLSELVKRKAVEYGDPPNYGCCPSGPTMTSEPERVLQFWANEHPTKGWLRVPELEVDVEAEWASAEPVPDDPWPNEGGES